MRVCLAALNDRKSLIVCIKDVKPHMVGICEKLYNRGYPKVMLGEVITQISERNRTSNISRVLSVSNIHGFVDQKEQFEDRVIASEDISNYKIVRRNDFAYNPARINVGSIARLSSYPEGIISPMYISFMCSQVIEPSFLESFFETAMFNTEVKKRLEGSVRMCLSFEGLCNIPIPLPDIPTQNNIGKQVATLSEKIAVESKVRDYLTRQKNYLLAKMLI